VAQKTKISNPSTTEIADKLSVILTLVSVENVQEAREFAFFLGSPSMNKKSFSLSIAILLVSSIVIYRYFDRENIDNSSAASVGREVSYSNQQGKSPSGENSSSELEVKKLSVPQPVESTNTELDPLSADAGSPISEGLPLVSIYKELHARASAGDEVATCRLLRETEACRRYREYVLPDNGRLRRYENIKSMNDLDALDEELFGMRMESLPVVCNGFDRHLREKDDAALLRTARDIKGTSVSIRAAIELQLQRAFDPKNVKIVRDRAIGGDAEAVSFLAIENSLPGSLYGEQVDQRFRDTEALRWLIVLKHVTGNQRRKLAIEASLSDLSAKISPAAAVKMREEAEIITAAAFKENTYQVGTGVGSYSLGREFCKG
jgi:hypothetical protein